MILFGEITDRTAWYHNQHARHGRVKSKVSKPIELNHNHYSEYMRCMEMYWEELDKHLRSCKPFRLPFDLGVFELIRYKVSATMGRRQQVDWGATWRYRRANPGSKKIIPANYFTTRESNFGYTDYYKFLLRHITFQPFSTWKSKGKFIVKNNNIRAISDGQAPLKRNRYFFKKYFSFLYKFRATKKSRSTISAWLKERPSRIYEIRESK